MTATISELRKQDKAARRIEALQTYRTLLRRNDAPQAGDREALEAAIAELELTDAEHDADLAALADAARLEAGIVGPDGLHRLRAALAAARADAAAEVRAELHRLVDAMDPAYLPAVLTEVRRWAQYTNQEYAAVAEVDQARAARMNVAELDVLNAERQDATAAAELSRLRRERSRALGTNGG